MSRRHYERDMFIKADVAFAINDVIPLTTLLLTTHPKERVLLPVLKKTLVRRRCKPHRTSGYLNHQERQSMLNYLCADSQQGDIIKIHQVKNSVS